MHTDLAFADLVSDEAATVPARSRFGEGKARRHGKHGCRPRRKQEMTDLE